MIEENKNRLVFEVESNYGLAELLIQELRKDKSINVATYAKDHPENKEIRYIIEGNDVKKSIKDAIKKLKERNNQFLKLIDEKINE